MSASSLEGPTGDSGIETANAISMSFKEVSETSLPSVDLRARLSALAAAALCTLALASVSYAGGMLDDALPASPSDRLVASSGRDAEA